ncbi:MAG TPA: endonuclease domain-containing protein, partial [Thermoanaerobaculia bacterium]|nr:endonuclease domain-containing protein [Thermoanaerobaculia bacterium]
MRYQRGRPLKALAKELRRGRTNAESQLWEILRRHGLCGFKVRRQHVLDKYIVDFFCPELRLIIEVDGGIHRDPDQQAYDARRSLDLTMMGFAIRRFTNEQVQRNPASAM